MSELSGDNASIKCVLDMKQNEWTIVTEKTKKLNNSAVKNTDKIDPRPNTFQVLQGVEETSPTNAQNTTEAYQTRGPSKDNLTPISFKTDWDTYSLCIIVWLVQFRCHISPLPSQAPSPINVVVLYAETVGA